MGHTGTTGDDESCCNPTLLSGVAVREACEDVSDAAQSLSRIITAFESVEPPPTEGFLWSTYVDVQQAIGQLTAALVEYLEPDAGIESMD